jgi:hypothetical protein
MGEERIQCVLIKGFFMTSLDFMTVASLLKMILGIVSQVIFLTVVALKILGRGLLFSSQYEPGAMSQSCFKSQLKVLVLCL